MTVTKFLTFSSVLSTIIILLKILNRAIISIIIKITKIAEEVVFALALDSLKTRLVLFMLF